MKNVKGHIEGNVVFNHHADYSEVQSIGGSLYCGGTTLPESAFAALTSLGDSLNCRCTLAKYISKRVSGRTIIWKVQICGSIKTSYVIERGGTYSHGKTLKEAKASLIFKITDRDTSKYEAWKLDTKVSAAEAIGSYRAITGACEFGVRDFCERHDIDLNKKFSPREIIQITDGAYGNQQYRRFFDTTAEGKVA